MKENKSCNFSFDCPANRKIYIECCTCLNVSLHLALWTWSLKLQATVQWQFCFKTSLMDNIRLRYFSAKTFFCNYQETASMMVLKDKLLACNKYKAMMWPNLKIKESSPSLQAQSSNQACLTLWHIFLQFPLPAKKITSPLLSLNVSFHIL